MYHIYRHTKGKLKGKYDFAFISNGKYICGSSPQGYDRRGGCISAIRMMMRKLEILSLYYQDDTTTESGVWFLSQKERFLKEEKKPARPYISNSKTVTFYDC